MKAKPKQATKRAFHPVPEKVVRCITEYVPAGFILHPWQTKVLLDVAAAWGTTDVFVILAPVASGKSLIAQTIARWVAAMAKTSATITPQVLLQEQYKASFPDVINLKGSKRYTCKEHKPMSCNAVETITQKYCDRCPYAKEKKAAQDSPNVVANFYSYMTHRLKKDVLIVDEAQTAFKTMQDLLTVDFWGDRHDIPEETPTYGDLAIWLEHLVAHNKLALEQAQQDLGRAQLVADSCKVSQAEKDFALDKIVEYSGEIARLQREVRRYEMCYQAMITCPEPLFVERGPQLRSGQWIDCVRMRPKTMEGLPPIFWTKSVQKVVLMSGTFNDLDLAKLGLSGRRITHLEIPNPIPPDNRKVVPMTNCNMASAYQNQNIGKLADILKFLANKHKDTKGLVHVTYSLSQKLQEVLDHPRFVFHDKDSKDASLKHFLNSSEPLILVGAGMAEGLDLAGDTFGWQVITKIMYANRGDKLWAHWYETEGDYVTWDAVRTTMQQTGRICRGVKDRGVTYITDSAFGNLATKQKGLIMYGKKFFSKDYLDSIDWGLGLALVSEFNRSNR